MSVAHGGAGIPEFTQGDRMRLSLKAQDVSIIDMADYMGVSRCARNSYRTARA